MFVEVSTRSEGPLSGTINAWSTARRPRRSSAVDVGRFLAFCAVPGGLIEGSGNLRYAQTMAFTTLVCFSLFTVFNSRSDERSAFGGMFSNHWLWGAIVLSIVLQAAVVYVPFLQSSFGTTSLAADDWLRCAAVGSSVLWLREATKVVTRASASGAHDV